MLLDSTFKITKLEQYIDGSGQGYTASGVPVYVNEGKKTLTKTNPVSDQEYSLYTGYQKYILVNEASGLGTKSTLTYTRLNSSTTYTDTFTVTLGA